MSEREVVIIGAGVVGLLTAQALTKLGIKCKIYESEPSEGRSRDWGMAVHWSMPNLEACLPAELFSQIASAQCDPFHVPLEHDTFTVRNGATGDVLRELPLVNMHRILRSRLRKLAKTGLDIKYGVTLLDIEDGSSPNTVTAVFDDGSRVTTVLLVGADGARSTVRRKLLPGPEGETLIAPYIATQVSVKYSDPEKARFVRQNHAIQTNAVHPKGLWSWISISNVENPDDPTTWTFQLMATWAPAKDQPLSTEVTLTELKERTSDLCEPFRSANQWLPDDTKVNMNRISYWIPSLWSARFGPRVQLAGDAAHAMSFQRGQGVNHGIADASLLMEAVKRVHGKTCTMGEAMAEYEAEVVNRAGEEVKVSAHNTVAMHDWDMLMDSPVMKRSAAASLSNKQAHAGYKM